jgi:hypothetical protein
MTRRQRWRRRWRDLWLTPATARHLALARVLVAGHALWILLSRDLAAISGVPPVFWSGADAWALGRYLVLPGHGGLEAALQGLAIAALACAIVGLAPRLACAVAAPLLYHLAPLETLIWSAAPDARGLTLAPVALLLLAAAPSDHALTLWPRPRGEDPTAVGVADRSARAAASRGRRPPRPRLRYGWALRALHWMVLSIFFLSLVGKLQRTGLDWGSAEHLRLWFLWFTQDPDAAVFTRLGGWLATSPALAALAGAGTMLFEALALGAFAWRRAAPWFAACALLFHVGTLTAMNIHVPEAWLVVLLFLGSPPAPAATQESR